MWAAGTPLDQSRPFRFFTHIHGPNIRLGVEGKHPLFDTVLKTFQFGMCQVSTNHKPETCPIIRLGVESKYHC